MLFSHGVLSTVPSALIYKEHANKKHRQPDAFCCLIDGAKIGQKNRPPKRIAPYEKVCK